MYIKPGGSIEFEKYEINPPTAHLFTGLLKYWLRSMPEPLFTFQLYQQFIDTLGITDEASRVTKLGSLISMIPKHDRHLLFVLFSFCNEVIQHGEANKVTFVLFFFFFSYSNFVRWVLLVCQLFYRQQSCIPKNLFCQL